jgi:HD-GYP domain-containing protein (c-di-GMP phosphodiesterase class II)
MLSGGKSDLILMAERIAYSHHEWWNGEGYPRRLSEHSIPIEARIVGLADFFDAVSHARPYRNAWPLDRVLDEVRELAGTHFDARLVEVLLDTRCYRHISVTPPRGVAVVDAELDDAASQTLTRMFRVGAREA